MFRIVFCFISVLCFAVSCFVLLSTPVKTRNRVLQKMINEGLNRGGGGGPHVGCRLKFNYFVGCRLPFSTFVGCR